MQHTSFKSETHWTINRLNNAFNWSYSNLNKASWLIPSRTVFASLIQNAGKAKAKVKPKTLKSIALANYALAITKAMNGLQHKAFI